MAKPKRTDLTQERVRELFDYREDGRLILKVTRCGRAVAGSVAGSLRGDRYLYTQVDGRGYSVHRLIFLWHYGFSPENEIDHIDRNPLNNRVENLREVSSQCNMRNAYLWESNTSGVTGVGWRPTPRTWAAAITINKCQKYLYEGKDFIEAVAYRLAAEQCLGWGECNSTTSAYDFMQDYVKERSNDTNRISSSTSEATTPHQSTEAVPS